MKNWPFPIVVKPLSSADGGGFVAVAPQLPGCMSDGETPQEALYNAHDAITCWIEAATEMGRVVSPDRSLGGTI